MVVLEKKKNQGSVFGGELRAKLQGSKHAFSRIFPTFLIFRKGVLRNVPNILDVRIQIEFMKMSGYDLHYDSNTNSLVNEGFDNSLIEYRPTDDMYKYSRSLVNLFPVLSKTDFIVRRPGGCPIGKRDISWYVDIMSKFGILVDEKGGSIYLSREQDFEPPDHIYINNRSFSSTNIAMLCALEKRANVLVENPSIEPEIIDLITMMKSSGIDIVLSEDNNFVQLDARGADFNIEVDYSIMDDRNHVVNLIIGALLLDKRIIVKSEKPLHLEPFCNLLGEIEIKVSEGENLMTIEPMTHVPSRSVMVKTGPYPMICSDWQPLIATLAKKNLSIDIYEGLFESRLGYLTEYEKLGIQYKIDGNRKAVVFNRNKSHKDETINVTALDLRCGAGLGLLAMSEKSCVNINNAIQIQRGYQEYDMDLNRLVDKELFSYS